MQAYSFCVYTERAFDLAQAKAKRVEVCGIRESPTSRSVFRPRARRPPALGFATPSAYSVARLHCSNTSSCVLATLRPRGAPRQSLVAHRCGLRSPTHANLFACSTKIHEAGTIKAPASCVQCGWGESNPRLLLGRESSYH